MGYEFVGNIKGGKGDTGDPGPQGLPGPGAVPADTAVAGFISTEGGSDTQKASDARYRRVRRPQVYGRPTYGYGTSFMAGAWSTSPATSFFALAASAMGATETHNRGSGGSNTPSMPTQYMTGADAWTPGTSNGLIFLEAGIGEALSETVRWSYQSRIVFEECIRTALRWFRAKAVRTFDHASVNKGAWVFENASSGAVPMRALTSSVSGATFTITPGGPSEIVLLTAPYRAVDMDAANNGDYEVRVDSGPWLRATTSGRGDTRPTAGAVTYTFGSYRITGLTSTSVVTVRKTGAGKVWLLDRYLVMGNPTPPPVILVQDCTLVPRQSVATVRTNLCANPAMATNLSGWTVSAVPGDSATIQRNTSEVHQRSASLSYSWTAFTASTLPQLVYGFAAVAGKTYTLSVWVNIPWGTGRVKIAAGGACPDTTGAASTRNAQWHRISVTVTATSTGTINLLVQAMDVPVVGSQFFLTEALIEEGPLLRPYLDGGSPAAAWTGTAGSSTSTMAGVNSEGPWNLGANYGELASNASLDVYRAILRRIAASPEFADGTVTVADPDTQWDANYHLDPDGIHPNDAGHAVYADAIVRAAQSLVETSA